MRKRRINADIEDLGGEETLQTAAPPSEPSCRDRIEDLLLAHGCLPSEKLLDALEDLIEEMAIPMAAGLVRHLILNLKGRTLTEAVRGVVLGRDQSLRAVAKRAGVSHTGLLKAENRVR